MLIYYVVFFFLILRFAVTLFNFISNPKLNKTARKYTDLVSIVIPARNEQHDILKLLESIKHQDYQNFEVIVLDDSSTDLTYDICANFVKTDNRFRVVRGEPLPEGWLGKNFACHQLAHLAVGRYLLFLDADTFISPGLINNSINRMKMGKLTLLSLFTNQVMSTLGEWMVVPLMHFLLLNLLPLRLVRLTRNTAFSAASGQFMLFDASNYHSHHWHAQVKDRVVEDIAIMKLIKAYQYKAEALLANGFVSCRMYTGFKEAAAGFSKNLLAGFNNNIAGLICYLLLVMMGPLFIALYLDIQLLFFAVTLIILSRLMISLLSGQNPLVNILLHPFQMAAFVLISFLSIQKHLTKTITWKGRRVEN
ncbi:chlorobactene glucosyltransferase [Arcticibacter tournemirensis]|uniref:Glycosyltransferase n=1 Tax=Arcticibacter tournemirensis TaxID=699437 RepID=A0A5M9H9R0_9SPHI|nr:glycosyltransferase [Arcticibacter tournemirensis]KAA8482561.1 glycosyltransferase [Arcticibacter tournemirensis]TQM52529.1 chlorobactene glucosyltransferase [Arcticibacter tournemirensis]